MDDEHVKGFVVEKAPTGLTAEEIEDKIALRAVQNALITLDGVRVPEDNRLQKANSFRDTANVLRMTRPASPGRRPAAPAAPTSTPCATPWSAAVRPADREFQLVQDLLAQMLGNITASAAMCVRVSQLQDAGQISDEHASLAKAFCTVRMRETVGWARELMGGNGILLEYNVGRYVADAEAIYSYEGTREVNTLIVGRAITGKRHRLAPPPGSAASRRPRRTAWPTAAPRGDPAGMASPHTSHRP